MIAHALAEMRGAWSEYISLLVSHSQPESGSLASSHVLVLQQMRSAKHSHVKPVHSGHSPRVPPTTASENPARSQRAVCSVGL